MTKPGKEQSYPPPFRNADQARIALEKLCWRHGRYCRKCQEIKPPGTTVALGKTPKLARKYRCKTCGHHFSLTSGSLFHHTRVPLDKWWHAAVIMAKEPNCEAELLKRHLKVTYKTAWFMRERIRTALNDARTLGLL